MDIRDADIGFAFGGVEITPELYGPAYLSEFCRVLDQHVEQAKLILEWGSGLSSQALVIYGDNRWATEFFLTIDENQNYQDAVFRNPFRKPFAHPICLDQVGPRLSDRDAEVNYSSYPLTLSSKFDLIFIDGRRRMECALTAALLCDEKTVVILHDYRRARYQSVLALFEVVEDGPQFRVMRLRRSILQAIAGPGERVLADMNGRPASKG